MKSNTQNNLKYKSFSESLFSWVIIFVLASFSMVIFYKTAHAGLISFVNSIIGSEQASAKSFKSYYNSSQTMALPIAAVNFDPNPDKQFDAVPVIGGETLNADLASTNEISDETSTQISTYIVKEGDTISGVAKMFNVSVNTILWANDLNSRSVLKKGQTLIILPVNGIKYTVQKNDTILGIANKFHADANEIYSYNDLDSSSKIQVGQNLIIPNADLGSVSVVKTSSGSKLSYESTYSGYYSCPASGRLSQGLHGRNAIDIAIPVGTPLKASAAGKVIIDKSNGAWNGGYGNFVVISHANGTQTLYAHMYKSVVSLGEQVSKGQLIGYSGNTGYSTGPHLHFEIRGATNPFVDSRCR